MRDANRGRVYETERIAHRLMDRAGGGAHTLQIAGTTLTVPAEAKFGDVGAVARYVDDVLALHPVRERFVNASAPVRVRRRKGSRAAHYEASGHVIAVPDSAEGTWALRELVVLHELAHHLDPRDDGQMHGASFVDTLIELVGLVLGPEVGLVYRVLFTEAGVR
ncbi:TIGR04338 family metallohydrolase [Gordonia sp. PDNC005]|uniref:TIGR04338 family metallohydrolase n=1 Tax=Gordonia sp. PDNC005 TaxID=2811424 RepID=UPI00196422FF|nr:TIGR04338 family metallohydrolase [Gordonia sp. PDNC005]QRY61721.1 TIGR04338 family metallohydrolase [Gordonia sp. PDNC005]